MKVLTFPLYFWTSSVTFLTQFLYLQNGEDDTRLKEVIGSLNYMVSVVKAEQFCS